MKIEKIIKESTNAINGVNQVITGQDKEIQLSILELWKDELTQESFFLRGWRPYIGWCLAYLISVICIAITITIIRDGFKVDFDLDDMLVILPTILTGGSIAIARTVEKINKANKRR